MLFVLMLAAFADTLGAFLVLALLPYYATDLGASAVEVGWLVALFAVAQTVTAPLWGRLSDRVGRRPVILFGLAILVISFVTFALADSLLVLMLSRLAQGVGGGTVSVTFALISDVSKAHQTATRIGWLTAATSGAALVGPLLGSLLVPVSTSAPGLVAAFLCMASLAACAAFLPAPRSRTAAPDEGGPRRGEAPLDAGGRAGPQRSLVTDLYEVLRFPGRPLHLLIWTYVFGMFGTNAALAVVGLFLELRHGIGATQIWQFFAWLAGASLVLRVVLLPLALRAWGERRVMLQGAWILAVSLLALPLAESRWILALATVLMAAGQSLLYPATTALISLRSDEQSRGAVLGVQQTWGGLARIGGPVSAGLLFAIAPELPFITGGFVLAVWAAVISWAQRYPARI